MRIRIERSSQGSKFSRRKGGGSSFAEAMFRKNADNATYASAMFDWTLRKLDMKDTGYKFHRSIFSFWIKKGRKVILKMTFKEVEECRSWATHALEEEMEKKLIWSKSISFFS